MTRSKGANQSQNQIMSTTFRPTSYAVVHAVEGGQVSADLRQLERQVAAVEGIVVGLSDESNGLYKPYPSRPSPGNMTGSEWLLEFSRRYPGVDVNFPARNLTLAQLRIRITP